MAIPKMMLNMLIKPITKVAVDAYKQGKKDTNEGTYDEKQFEKDLKKLIENQF